MNENPTLQPSPEPSPDSRKSHMDWCKARALEYVERGDLENAMQSMLSDLQKHESTAGHPAAMLMMQLYLIGDLRTPAKMRHFIEGFN